MFSRPELGSLFRPNGREYNISPSNRLFFRGGEERVAPSGVITTILDLFTLLSPGLGHLHIYWK